jgi:two-component system OmpR family sensor kinase
MLKSLRARLLIWYSLILSIFIVVYAGTVTYLYRESLVRDVDADLAVTIETIAAAVNPDIDGTFDLNFPSTFRSTTFDDPVLSNYYAVWNATGELVDQSEPTLTPPSVPDVGVSTRLGRREVVVDAPGSARILAGRDLDNVDAAVRDLRLTVAGVGLLVLMLSLAGSFVLAGRALAPVARISETAGAMIGGDLDARIPVKGTASELEQVARALNEAFDRMRVGADQQRQFTADASHELRTPLTTLRAEFEWALRRPRSADEYKASIEKGQKAVERMTELADRLLTLVRPGASPGIARDLLELTSLVKSATDLLSPLAASHGVTVEMEFARATISGERSLLIDAFSNLLKNAIEYNRPGGRVSVRVSTEPGWAVVAIRDTGVGIAAEDLPRIFERFYRADRSRTRGGAGLGLAIVRSIVDEHGGTVTCTSEPGHGSEFTVRLPLAVTGGLPPPDSLA